MSIKSLQSGFVFILNPCKKVDYVAIYNILTKFFLVVLWECKSLIFFFNFQWKKHFAMIALELDRFLDQLEMPNLYFFIFTDLMLGHSDRRLRMQKFFFKTTDPKNSSRGVTKDNKRQFRVMRGHSGAHLSIASALRFSVDEFASSKSLNKFKIFKTSNCYSTNSSHNNATGDFKMKRVIQRKASKSETSVAL